MDGLIFLIIIAVIIHNFRKQQKRVQKPQGGTQPPQSAPVNPIDEDIPAEEPIAPAQTREVKQVRTTTKTTTTTKTYTAHTSTGKLPRPFSPEMRRFELKPDAPRDVDSPAQGTSPAREQPTVAARDMGLNCDDGYGSLPHTGHEGQELHGAGAHSDAAISARYAPKPFKSSTAPGTSEQGDVLGELSMADACADDGEAPMLMGRELTGDEMRRAVILSEVLNKRGGRRGWVRT